MSGFVLCSKQSKSQTQKTVGRKHSFSSKDKHRFLPLSLTLIVSLLPMYLLSCLLDNWKSPPLFPVLPVVVFVRELEISTAFSSLQCSHHLQSRNLQREVERADHHNRTISNTKTQFKLFQKMFPSPKLLRPSIASAHLSKMVSRIREPATEKTYAISTEVVQKVSSHRHFLLLLSKVSPESTYKTSLTFMAST
jgi:hypothetical protein